MERERDGESNNFLGLSGRKVKRKYLSACTPPHPCLSLSVATARQAVTGFLWPHL
jgi:hypothetical protein